MRKALLGIISVLGGLFAASPLLAFGPVNSTPTVGLSEIPGSAGTTAREVLRTVQGDGSVLCSISFLGARRNAAAEPADAQMSVALFNHFPAHLDEDWMVQQSFFPTEVGSYNNFPYVYSATATTYYAAPSLGYTTNTLEISPCIPLQNGETYFIQVINSGASASQPIIGAATSSAQPYPMWFWNGTNWQSYTPVYWVNSAAGWWPDIFLWGNTSTSPLGNVEAQPGVDPFVQAFLGSYGIRTTSTIAELQAMHASVTSTCPDIFLLHGACEFAAWLLVPDLEDLGSMYGAAAQNASTRLPLNYVVGFWEAMSSSTSFTTSTGYAVELPLSSTTQAILFTTSTVAMRFDPKTAIDQWVPDIAKNAMRTATTIVLYLWFIEGCYATWKRLFV